MTSVAQAEALTELFAGGDVLVLSGAGISTDSGIPCYREPDGTQRNATPVTFQRFVGSSKTLDSVPTHPSGGRSVGSVVGSG